MTAPRRSTPKFPRGPHTFLWACRVWAWFVANEMPTGKRRLAAFREALKILDNASRASVLFSRGKKSRE